MSGLTKTAKLSQIPVVLVVGGSLDLLARVWEASSHAGAIVRAVVPAGVAAAIRGFRPLAVVMTEAVFAPLAAEIEPLVKENAGTIVRLASEDVSNEELDGRLRAAVIEADTLRREASPSTAK